METTAKKHVINVIMEALAKNLVVNIAFDVAYDLYFTRYIITTKDKNMYRVKTLNKENNTMLTFDKEDLDILLKNDFEDVTMYRFSYDDKSSHIIIM